MFDREERSIAAIFPTPAEWSLFRSQADVLIPKFVRTVNDSGLYLHVYAAQCLWLVFILFFCYILSYSITEQLQWFETAPS